MAHQFCRLAEIAAKFREHMISIEALKRFHDYVRCASYPDPNEFAQKRDAIEKAWPAYAGDRVLSLAPAYAWEALRSGCSQVLQQSVDLSTWEMDGRRWLTLRNERLQHVLSHMNHHIHLLKDDGSGERRLLAGCKSKANCNICKGGFPLDAEVTSVPLLVCRCIAQERGLPIDGRRSMLGSILPSRNEPNLNADRRLVRIQR